MTDRSEDAVSYLVGFILVLSIIVGIIGIIQVYQVPQWMKAVEATHHFRLQDKFEMLHDKIIDAANYGYSTLTLPIELKYPSYPLLTTPNVISGRVYSENIGEIKIGANGRILTFPLQAIVLEPRYYFSAADSELYSIGYLAMLTDNEEGFVVNSFQEPGFNLIITNITASRNVLNLYGARVEIRADWINVSSSKFGWLIDSVHDDLVKNNIPINRYLPRNYVNFTVDYTLMALIVGSDESTLTNMSQEIGGMGGLEITIGEGETQGIPVPVGQHSSTLIDFESNFTVDMQKGDYLVGSPLYIMGYTPFSSTIVNVNIEYTFVDVKGEHTVNISTKWQTFPNGYFQFPLTIPGAYKETGEPECLPYWVNVTLVFPENTITQIPIYLGERCQGGTGQGGAGQGGQSST